MDHDLIHRIHHDTHMTCTAGLIGSLEKDKIAGLYISRINSRGCVLPSVCRKSSIVPSVPAVIDHITNEAGTVKAACRAVASPHIGKSEMILGFMKHVSKLRIRQILTGNRIIFILRRNSCIGIGVIAEDLRFVSLHLQDDRVSLHLFISKPQCIDCSLYAIIGELRLQDVIVILDFHIVSICFRGSCTVCMVDCSRSCPFFRAFSFLHNPCKRQCILIVFYGLKHRLNFGFGIVFIQYRKQCCQLIRVMGNFA